MLEQASEGIAALQALYWYNNFYYSLICMPYWFGPINFDSCTLTEVSYNEKYNRVSDNNTVTICDCWYKGIQRGEKVHSK